MSLYKNSALIGNSPEICRRHYAGLISEAMEAEAEFGGADRAASGLAAF
ncbi:MAG: hypothetical protein AAGH92_12465 [Planctomycetota bacterium]